MGGLHDTVCLVAYLCQGKHSYDPLVHNHNKNVNLDDELKYYTNNRLIFSGTVYVLQPVERKYFWWN